MRTSPRMSACNSRPSGHTGVTMRAALLTLAITSGCFGSLVIQDEPAEDAGIVMDAAPESAIAPGCECVEGPCCDGCAFVDSAVKCIDDGTIGPATCTGPDRLRSPIGDRWCSGTSSLCDGVRVPNGAASIEGQCASVLSPGSCSESSSPLGVTCSR